MSQSGLLVAGKKTPLPLRGVSVDAEIKGYVLGLRSSLKYFNDSADPVEVLFRFPVEQSHAVVGLTAVIDGRRIKAQIKEKEEAKAAYDDAIASGQSAALAEEKSGDVFSISLGNLPPQKEAEILLQLVGELGIDAEGSVRFSLPSTLKPRYTPAGSTDPLQPVPSGEEGQVEQAKVSGVKGFKLRVRNADDIAEVTSPTHGLSVTAEGGDILVSLSEEKELGKDLVVLIKQKDPHRPRVMVENGVPSDNEFMSSPAVMINFFPEFTDVEAACEFIFLVDRSGSMSGSYIRSARETLILFLKSIPEGSYFNIIGFGSRFEKLFPDSVSYSQDTLDKAVQHSQSMNADLGGTELLPPLEYIFSVKPRSGYPRQIFVLTDGSVSNTQACIQTVKKNVKTSRCFTFGIGSGASTALVEGLSKAGNGTAEFVKEGERMQPKVIRSLKRALQPAVTDVKVEFKVPGGYEVQQSPQNLPPVFNGEKLVVYGVLKHKGTAKDGSGKAVLKGVVLGKTIEHSVSFQLDASPAEVPGLPSAHHLAGKALLKDWEEERKSKESIVKLSIESSVISSKTAFVAIDEENSEPISGAMKTWDIQADIASEGMLNMQYCLASSSGYAKSYASAPKKKGGGGFGGFFSSLAGAFSSSSKSMKAAPEPQMARSSAQPRRMMERDYDSAMASYDIDDDSYNASSDDELEECLGVDELAPEPASLAELSKESPGDLEERLMKLTESDYRSPPKPKPQVVDLSSFVTVQQANGSWNLNPSLSQLLGKAQKDLEVGCPVECVGPMAAVWATVLVLSLLRLKYSSQQEEWELIAMKAESWLKRQSLPPGMTLSDLNKAADKIFS